MTDVHVPPDFEVEEELTFECAYCEDTFHEDQAHYHYQGMCVDCGNNTYTCEWCNDTVTQDSYSCDNPSVLLCCSCWESTSYCDNCGHTYDSESYSGCPNICGVDNDRLLNYGYKPMPVFHTPDGTMYQSEPGVVYMGVELEMESRDRSVNDGVDVIADCLGDFVYCKEDGSLNDGIEMVTHPFTLEYAQNRDWSVLDELRRMGFRSWNTNTCGMHIHVSRSAFNGSSHLYRFTQLVLKNEPACTSFAGRKNDTYATFRDGYRPGFIAKIIKGREHGSRGAVNLYNGSTVEVRMFRGSLRINRLLANVEFVHAAVEYTRKLTVPQVATGGLSWRSFATWITDHRNTYPHLFEYLSLDPGTPKSTDALEYTTF